MGVVHSCNKLKFSQDASQCLDLVRTVIFSFVYSCVRTALLPPFEMKLFNDLSLPAYWESIGIKQIFQFDVTEEYI